MFNKKMKPGFTDEDIIDDLNSKYENKKIDIPGKFEILQSPNYSHKEIDAKVLVIHWTGGSFESCVSWMMNNKSNVSAHFVVDKMGENVTQLCDLKYKAWHAGYSYLKPYGYGANNYSIGIEIEGPPSKTGDKWWYKSCIQTIAKIVGYIKDQGIKLEGIVDHSTISPIRKIDVLDNTKKVDTFPWSMLIQEIWKYDDRLIDLATVENKKMAKEFLQSKGMI